MKRRYVVIIALAILLALLLCFLPRVEKEDEDIKNAYYKGWQAGYEYARSTE